MRTHNVLGRMTTKPHTGGLENGSPGLVVYLRVLFGEGFRDIPRTVKMVTLTGGPQQKTYL